MKNKITYLIIAISSIIFLAGCSTSKPYAMGGELYRVTSTGAGFSAESVTENVYESARKYAKEKGMVMYPESINVRDGAFASHPPSAELIFRLVETNSPEANSAPKFITGLTKVQIINNKKEKTTKTKTKTLSSLSIEEKLTKIKNLYANGLITKNEYNEKRKKIISNY